MREALIDPVGWVACGPMFVEDGDGFALTDEARSVLAAVDSVAEPTPALPTVIDRVAAVHEELRVLAGLLPGAVRDLPPHDLIDVLETLQWSANLIGSCDQAVVAEVDRNPSTERWGYTSTAVLMVNRLRVRPAEATRRVATARACSVRPQLTGEVLPPERPHVAAAQAAGEVNPDQAKVIDRGLGRLPRGVPVAEVDRMEQILVDAARDADAGQVAKAVRRMLEVCDPDGPEPREEQRHRLRDLRLTQRDDGAGVLSADLTSGLYVKLNAVLSSLAAPRPADATGPDLRSHGQRMHDALDDVCDRLLRSGTLPDCGGVPATITIAITEQQLQHWTEQAQQAQRAASAPATASADSATADTADETPDLRVHTSFGDVSIAEAIRMACQAEIIPVVLNDAGGILSYGTTRRCATPAQTKALRARDRGCTVPGCLVPPEWCERHHVIAWLLGGETALDNLALVCGYHHRNFPRWGWRCIMRDGKPWWIPPPDIDPDQKPLQNTAH